MYLIRNRVNEEEVEEEERNKHTQKRSVCESVGQRVYTNLFKMYVFYKNK